MIEQKPLAPREFWICDVWDVNKLTAQRYTLDADPGIKSEYTQIIHAREVDPKYDEAVKRLWEDMATLANCLSDPKWKQFAKESYENWEKTLK